VIGFVAQVRETTGEDLSFPLSALRALGPEIEGLDLGEAAIDLIDEVARQTLAPLPTCLTLITPPGLRDRLVRKWLATGNLAQEPLTLPQEEILSALASGEIIESKTKPLPDSTKSVLRSLVKRGLAKQVMTVSQVSEKRKGQQFFRLTPDLQAIEQFLAKRGKRSPAQAYVLMKLQGSEAVSFSSHEIKAMAGVTDQTVKALVTGGLLVPGEEDDTAAKIPPLPNQHQAAAIQACASAIQGGQFMKALLYGVTGSGKTEVYLRVAEAALAQGRQVLYLVPEIALTAQVIAQLRERFGRSVAVLHSNLTPTERLDAWLRVRRGEAPVVLGPRSALFAPLTNLGLIILDEEHEGSYKQESAPRYYTKSVALWLGQQHHAAVILGSATPSIESFYEAQCGELELLKLPQRAANAQLPEIFVQDLTEVYKLGRPSLFSPLLQETMTEALARKEQIILFLNRRAYAPFVVCRDCGHKFVCQSCAVSLSYHRHSQTLRCHHCDHEQKLPDICPQCLGTKISAFGVGAEKVEEAARALFPTAQVARLDRDIARKKGALEDIFAQFRSGALDILVGTQMVAKGLDFPRVTVVGVIAADISLGIPDFRSSERTFQLLSQVAGRAGRGQTPGKVVIQTLSPNHPSIVATTSHDFESLYESLVRERELTNYPPFSRLVNILFVGPERPRVVQVSAIARQRLEAGITGSGGEVVGPADCPLEKLNNQYRRHILVKLRTESDPEPIAEALKGLDSSHCRITLDVDAYHLT
jgi:primosomal protein N' (replication factor Y)